MIDLYRINLNLLVALDVLLSEKSVTKAAAKLHMTQAAMSNNLQQLRYIFKDELLIREKNYMILTSYAVSLQANLHQLLEEVRSLITAGQRFIPMASQRTFKIAMSDYMSALLMPKLLKSLEKSAPRVKIIVLSPGHISHSEVLESGEYDVMISKFFEGSPGIKKQFFFKDKPVCVMNNKHTLVRKKVLTLEDYLACQHIAMRSDCPDMPRFLDEALAALCVQRDVKISTSFMSTIFQVIQESQLLLGTVAEKVAQLYKPMGNFIIKPLPFIDREVEFYLFWHQRYQNDLGHVWLREQLMGVFNVARE